MKPTAPHKCPRFDSCSAPICPLDPHALKRTMLRDERVCHYIRNFRETFADNSLDREIAVAVKELIVGASLNAALARALKRLGK